MRNPLTDTPDWRYGVALKEVQREAADLPIYEPSADPGVLALKRLLPLRSTRGKTVDPDKRLSTEWMVPAELSLRIYADQGVCGLRDIMEAALLAPDASIKFFQEHVNRHLSPTVVMTYKSLFYDIDMNKDMKFWVQRNLFVPNKQINDKAKLDSAFMWKVVSYHGGIKSLVKYAIDGVAFEDELRNWLRRMGVSEYVKQVLKSTHSYAKLLDSAGTPAMPAVGSWDKQDAVEEDTSSDMVAESGSAISAAIVADKIDKSQEAEYMTSNKFTDED